jgi:CheY-like chemotaxis protein
MKALDSFSELPMSPSFLAAPGSDAAASAELARWQELLAQAGRELAEPLTAALERVATLTTTGRIDRAGLRTLRDEVDRARQAGIWCQQIARLASGHVRQSHERVHLTHTLQSVLAIRARELQSRGIRLTQTLQEAEVQIDASMLHGLLNAMVEWWLGCAQGTVDVQLDLAPHTRITCRFEHGGDMRNPTIDSMNWHLLEQTARTLGLAYERQIDPAQVLLTISFALGNQAQVPDIDPAMPEAAFGESLNSKPLAGSHVLVVSSHREVRGLVREALKSMGLVVNFVSSVAEAIEFCRDVLPHGIVFETRLRTPKFAQLVNSIRQEVPEFVFIELLDEGDLFEISSVSETGMARVGRKAVSTSLPSALVYELTRTMSP